MPCLRVVLFGVVCGFLSLLSGCASSSRMMRLGADASHYKQPDSTYLSSRKIMPGTEKKVIVPPSGRSRFDSDLVNLWPFFLKSDDYWTALWPMIDRDSYGFAVRPFYNREGDEHSVLFPLSGWNTATGNGWLLNTVWTEKSLCVFPMATTKDGKLRQLLLFFRDGKEWICVPVCGNFKDFWFAGPIWGKRSYDAAQKTWKTDRGGFFPLLRLSERFNYCLLGYWNNAPREKDGTRRIKNFGVFPIAFVARTYGYFLNAFWSLGTDAESGKKKLDQLGVVPLFYMSRNDWGYFLNAYWSCEYDFETKTGKFKKFGVFPVCRITDDFGYVGNVYWNRRYDLKEKQYRHESCGLFPVAHFGDHFSYVGPLYWKHNYGSDMLTQKFKCGGLFPVAYVDSDSGYVFPVAFWNHRFASIGPVWWRGSKDRGVFPLYWKVGGFQAYGPVWLDYDSQDKLRAGGLFPVLWLSRKAAVLIPFWCRFSQKEFGLFPIFAQSNSRKSGYAFPLYYYDYNRYPEKHALNVLGLFHRARRYSDAERSDLMERVDLWGPFFREWEQGKLVSGRRWESSTTALFPLFARWTNSRDASGGLNLLGPLFTWKYAGTDSSVSPRTLPATLQSVSYNFALIGNREKSRLLRWKEELPMADRLYSQYCNWLQDKNPHEEFNALGRWLGLPASRPDDVGGRADLVRQIQEQNGEEIESLSSTFWPLWKKTVDPDRTMMDFLPFFTMSDERSKNPQKAGSGLFAVRRMSRQSLLLDVKKNTGVFVNPKVEILLNNVDDYLRRCSNELIQPKKSKDENAMVQQKARIQTMLRALGEPAELPATLPEWMALRRTLLEKYGTPGDWLKWNSMLLLSGARNGSESSEFRFIPFYETSENRALGTREQSVFGPFLLNRTEFRPPLLKEIYSVNDDFLDTNFPRRADMVPLASTKYLSLAALSGVKTFQFLESAKFGQQYPELWSALARLNNELNTCELNLFSGNKPNESSLSLQTSIIEEARKTVRKICAAAAIPCPNINTAAEVSEFADRLKAESSVVSGSEQHYLFFLYNLRTLGNDSKFNLLGFLARGHRFGEQETSFRLLEYLFRYERRGEYREYTVFPFLTFRNEGDKRSVSFLWRLFRREQRGEEVKYHLFFIPCN